MTYFGGLGAGKGWLKYLFLVEPEILEDALIVSKAALIIVNSRVPADYQSTQRSEYVQMYRDYLEAMMGSPDAARRASFAVQVGLASSLDKFAPKLCPDERFKLMNPAEPVVNLRPETLHYNEEKGQLSTNVMSKLYFGLELSYPRVVSLSQEKHELLHDATAYSSFAIFESIKSQIHAATVPCKLRSPAREHRTPIRITLGMREKVRSHPGLIAAHLEVV
jgi:hypothetical protein